MNICALGGGQLGYQQGVYGWALVPDFITKVPERIWYQVSGLNNIGLLVKTWGTVTEVGTGYFCVGEGLGPKANTVKVYGTASNIEAADLVGKFVSVTGVCGCEKPSDYIIPVIKTRTVDDISVLN
jgi:hypothetical protein